MGCSSGSLEDLGDFDPSGPILAYVAADSAAVVGNLWTVTDKDLDKVTKSILQGWLSPPDNTANSSLLDCVQRARNEPKLKYANGAALVHYGMPIHKRNH